MAFWGKRRGRSSWMEEGGVEEVVEVRILS